MVWIKYFFILVLTIVIVIVGVEFFYVNTDPVTVNYILGTVSMPLAIVVLLAFTAGIALTLLIGFFKVTAMRWHLARLQRAVSNQEQAIGALHKKSS